MHCSQVINILIVKRIGRRLMSGTWYRRRIRDPGTQAYIFFKFIYYWVYIYDLVLLNLIINIVNTSRKFWSSLYDAYDGCVCRNVSCCQHCFPTIFLLAVRSVVISVRYQAFFRFGRNSTFSHHPVRCLRKLCFCLGFQNMFQVKWMCFGALAGVACTSMFLCLVD